MRTSERRYLDQIQSLELDVTKAGHALERSRESYSALKKNYEDQLAEAESLRNLIVSIRQVSWANFHLRLLAESMNWSIRITAKQRTLRKRIHCKSHNTNEILLELKRQLSN